MVLITLKRVPFTLSVVSVLLVIAIWTGSLWKSFENSPLFHSVATGLPAFVDNQWYTLATSPWFVNHPLVYIFTLPLVIFGLGISELRFGSIRTLALFAIGHVVGVVLSAGIVQLLASTGWEWGLQLATARDVGPSAGAITALVFGLSTLPSPWRLRARLAVGLWGFISVLYLGQLYDLEHAVVIFLALLFTGFLPAFRRFGGRPSTREWRLLAFTALIAIGVVQVLDLIVPYNGPLGQNHPIASFTDVAIDVIVIALIANGSRLGFKIAWRIGTALAVFNIVTAAILLVFATPLAGQVSEISPSEIVKLVAAPTLFWIVMLFVLVIARGSFQVPLRRAKRLPEARGLNRDEMIDMLKSYGGCTISWMQTWRDNNQIATELKPAGVDVYRGSAEAAFAYQSHNGTAIMLGDPVTGVENMTQAFEAFAGMTQKAGLVPCAFSVSAAAAAAKPEGWRAAVVAADTIVDLPGLEFKGKPWAHVRTAINRADREGVKFEMVRLAEAPYRILAQVRAISEQWTGDKGLPEMRFTLGTVDEALDPEVWVGIATDEEGDLHGITSWLPVYGGEGRISGWTLDLMRRRDDGFGPVMEFLIGSAALHFSEQGFDFVSLSGAPLVRIDDGEATAVDDVLAGIAQIVEPLYGFSSLHRFKQKFNPRSEPLYLLYRDEGDLARIGIAITKAYLPDATMRDLISAVKA